MRIGALLGSVSSSRYAWSPDVAVCTSPRRRRPARGASIDVGSARHQRPDDARLARAGRWPDGTRSPARAASSAAFAMSILLQAGFVDVTTGLLLCAVVSAVGVASSGGTT
jgi:hypothetical protein